MNQLRTSMRRLVIGLLVLLLFATAIPVYADKEYEDGPDPGASLAPQVTVEIENGGYALIESYSYPQGDVAGDEIRSAGWEMHPGSEMMPKETVIAANTTGAFTWTLPSGLHDYQVYSYKITQTMDDPGKHYPEPMNAETWGQKGDTQFSNDSPNMPQGPKTPLGFYTNGVEIRTIELFDSNGNPATRNSDGKTYTVNAYDVNGKVIGKYIYDPSKDNKSATVNGRAAYTCEVRFVPNEDFVGDPLPATLRATDVNGHTAESTYTPHVTEKTDKQPPTAYNAETIDLVNRTQKGTIRFKPGSSPITSVKFIDPATGQPTDATEIDVYDENGNKVGTYKLLSTTARIVVGDDGEEYYEYDIEFTPVKDYIGTPPSITLRAYDENGLFADGVYQPKVVGSEEEIKKPEKKAPTTSVSGKTGTTKKVKTGDENPLLLWGLLIAASLTFLIVSAIRRSRR